MFDRIDLCVRCLLGCLVGQLEYRSGAVLPAGSFGLAQAWLLSFCREFIAHMHARRFV